jgi:phage RecT family recombinase
VTLTTQAIQKRVSPIDATILATMETINKRQARLELLLPKGSDVRRFQESFRLALAAQPYLLKCTPESLVLAVLRGARTGLPVDGSGGLAWIVPYGQDATYVPGYKGLIVLAKATGLVKDMQPIPVYKRDTFDYQPSEDNAVTHKVYFPETDSEEDDRGPLRAVYCKTTLPDGTKRYDVMSLKDIRGIQAKSRAKNGPWVSDFEQMALKTVVKRGFKTLGVPPGDVYKALRVALAADEAAETGETPAELEALESSAKPTANERLRSKLGVDTPPDDVLFTETPADVAPEPGSEG